MTEEYKGYPLNTSTGASDEEWAEVREHFKQPHVKETAWYISFMAGLDRILESLDSEEQSE